MSIWIITTGNSDVQLKINYNWENLFYEEVRYDEEKDIKNVINLQLFSKIKLPNFISFLLGY